MEGIVLSESVISDIQLSSILNEICVGLAVYMFYLCYADYNLNGFLACEKYLLPGSIEYCLQLGILH